MWAAEVLGGAQGHGHVLVLLLFRHVCQPTQHRLAQVQCKQGGSVSADVVFHYASHVTNTAICLSHMAGIVK